MLQSFQDEFDLEENKRAPRTPAEAGDCLSKGEDLLSKGEQTEYRSGVGKLLHMMRWTRPEIYNRVRELSRFMSGATEQHQGNEESDEVLRHIQEAGTDFEAARRMGGNGRLHIQGQRK